MNVPSGAIVAGIDASADSDRGLAWAAAEAEARGAPLHLLHALPPLRTEVPPTADEERIMRDHAQGVVTAARNQARRITSAPVTAEVVDEPAAPALIAASRHAELVVLGARGHSAMSGLLLGSVSQQVCAHAHGPVVVVREAADPNSRRVVVGVDGSPGSDRAIGYAMQAAARDGAPVTAIYGWHDHSPLTTGTASPGWDRTAERIAAGDRMLENALAAWTTKYPEVTVVREAIPVPPARTLAGASEHAAMVVVGARGHGGFAELRLGSVSRALLHHARCPVAVIR
ncbi:universal stress protein [Pseudonocardia acaciae]|uniref:universal stress protein n=1 Tax=Pseudonocardia acaciae TaxID=551276 RepID=UPI00048F629B|nr:universal stress protein [Pseudonocardia acaciae]